ncbi:MAG: hypothetical protein KDC67_15520, partial [Ignavibacteriae bacterium]|nr:hypothetical protein [Ignavibacteriota bacterium]
MSYILVQDRTQSLKPLFPISETKTVSGNSLNDIVEKFKTLDVDKYDIIIINCEACYGSESKHTDFEGIELLKWLRIHLKICNIIIMT